MCVSSTADLVSPLLVDHHRRTAYLASRIGRAMGLDEVSLGRAVLAASLHDVGALSLGERLDTLDFDTRSVEHAEPGYALLKEFEPFAEIAPIVRYHHVEWQGGLGAEHLGTPVPVESNVVYLADRIAVLMDPTREPAHQTREISSAILESADKRFNPETVLGFVKAAREAPFWSGLAAEGHALEPFAELGLRVCRPVEVDLSSFSKMLAHIVDFRSRYTAAHSTGVAASADVLARVLGMTVRDVDSIRVAGHLHDLGKLAVPEALIEKPSRLDHDESLVMMSHAYHTGRVLGAISELAQVADWASHHHERIDGSGYPDHLEGRDLALGARVVAVSDIFTALSEDRSYRPALGRGRVLRSLKHMAKVRYVDGRVVEALSDCSEQVHAAREAAQERAREHRNQLVNA
jgi:HD-GYP domain-containing protein (c-di-GMP phosphodiesterase class II)